jgi:uncharacterized membrane protein YqgA involved in biofilm formation
MMFIGSGTLINVLTIIGGAGFGVLIGGRMPERMRALITDVLGLITILGAATTLTPITSDRYVDALPKGWPLLAVLASLLLGGVLGSALNLEDRLEAFGHYLRRRFKAERDGTFVEGFLLSSLLFVIGPLAILGSISDGMGTGTDQLILKSSLDFFAAMAFAATLGWGVAASAIPVGIYQGLWTIAGFALGSVLADYQIDAMTIVGGLMLLSIGLGLLKIKTIAVGNLLPALALAPIVAGVLHQFA